MKSPKQQTWPTLEGRLKYPLTSRKEAIRQLQCVLPITPLAKSMLTNKSKKFNNATVA